MMENIGLGMMMETPCVVVNIMRAGPSTGLPTLVAQGDVMQARWGSHGDYGVIALCPSSPQEMFDLVIQAFNLSERYRMPVFVLSDEIVGHMFERVVIPEKKAIRRVERKRPRAAAAGGGGFPFLPDSDLVPPMACAGEGYHMHVTGLTHDERGYPVVTAEAQERLVRRLCDKVRGDAEKIAMVRRTQLSDAEIAVVAYGCTARAAREAVNLARERKTRAGLLQLLTVWPFPEREIRELVEAGVRGFVVPEVNYGQIAHEVERCAGGREVCMVGLMGGRMHTPEMILEAVEELRP